MQAVRAAEKSRVDLSRFNRAFPQADSDKGHQRPPAFSGSDEQFSLYTDKSAAPDEELLLAALSHLLDTQTNCVLPTMRIPAITAVLSLCALAKKHWNNESTSWKSMYLSAANLPLPWTGPVRPKTRPTDAGQTLSRKDPTQPMPGQALSRPKTPTQPLPGQALSRPKTPNPPRLRLPTRWGFITARTGKILKISNAAAYRLMRTCTKENGTVCQRPAHDCVSG